MTLWARGNVKSSGLFSRFCTIWQRKTERRCEIEKLRLSHAGLCVKIAFINISILNKFLFDSKGPDMVCIFRIVVCQALAL